MPAPDDTTATSQTPAPPILSREGWVQVGCPSCGEVHLIPVERTDPMPYCVHNGRVDWREDPPPPAHGWTRTVMVKVTPVEEAPRRGKVPDMSNLRALHRAVDAAVRGVYTVAEMRLIRSGLRLASNDATALEQRLDAVIHEAETGEPF